MNFAEFQQLRESLRSGRQDLIDCAETNLYRTLSRLIPPSIQPISSTVHRCHLASEWSACFGFSPDTSRRALISCGVRDSLARLFRHYSTQGATLWLPADNYPVYSGLSLSAGLVPLPFPTLPEPAWPASPTSTRPELLLLTNSLKPLGRYLTAGEVQSLKSWLAASPARRLLIDAVYTFDLRFHSTTLDLLETGQAILLHSLTKGWLHPRLFGIALVPEADASALTPSFRANPPPQGNLARARDLMSTHAAMPAAVACELDGSMRRLRQSLAIPLPPPHPSCAPGYFLTVSTPWRELLESYGILGLPASTFGSQREDLTILSNLTFCA